MFLTPKQFRVGLFFCLLVTMITISANILPSKNSQGIDYKNSREGFREIQPKKGSTTNSQEFIDFEYYANQISDTYFLNIKNHIEFLSSFGSRVTGYPGYEQTVDYIHDFFRNQNLSSIQTLSYPILIPYDYETKIAINGENFTAHALIPNSVQACKTHSGGLTGSLVYGGSGTFSELDGKKIEDSIVVLEFNTRDNWIKVASLGAKAVIYLPPDNTDRFEAEVKSIDIPLDFPRIYINNKTTANTIKQLSVQLKHSITLYLDVEWVSVDAKNVMGLLPGLDDEIIIISAHFDSSSVVPSIAPGADEACGIATLLELIRVMKNENITPQKTIMFLALSGHNQAAAGARDFVYQNFDILNVKGGIKLFLSLDLSTSNNKIGLNPYGYLYKFQLRFTLGNNLFTRLKTIGEDFLINYAERIREATGDLFEVESYINLQNFEQIAPISFIGDHEPFIASNILGLSFYTAESRRIRFNTPFDKPNYLQFDMLRSQVVYSICALVQLINEENLDNYLDLTHKDFSLKHTTHVGFGNIEGHCKEYNETTGWLTNVPNALIRLTSQDTNTGIQGTYSYYTKTDENGYYQVRGVSSSQPDDPLEFFVEAYVFNSEGRLIKATNLGEYGKFFKRSQKLVENEITINPIVFSCGTVSFFGVLHPLTLSPSARVINYEVLDPETRTQLFSYGHLGAKSVSLVFMSPETPSIVIGKLPDGELGVYVTNSSTDTLRGKGLLIHKGEFKNLGIISFNTLKDIQSLTQSYIDLLATYGIHDDQVIKSFQRTSILIDSAIQLKKNYEYSKAIETISESQIWSYRSLKQARDVIAGAISTAILFAFLLIPFSFILSQLLFNINSSIKWIFTTSAIYALSFSFFYVIHPAFQVAPHLILTLLGVINVVSVLFVILWLYQEVYGYLKRQRLRMLGSHFPSTSNMSEILMAVKTGISRMKKHKIRTIINLSSIGLLTFSLTLYTSASALIGVNFLGLGLPVAIAILLMINTSISTVYTSKREIFIYTSIGLTPAHIVDLFLTEFLVSAVIGSITGYFGGITFIRIVSAVGLIPKTLPINYSSGVVVTAIAFSGAGMFLSILYPLKISGKMSVPSLKRSWELTTFPIEDGTKWNIHLPIVTSSEQEAEGIITFLWEYFLIYESENVGGQFFVSNMLVKNIKGRKKQLTATVNLAPFDMGIIQIMIFFTYYDKIKDHWKFEINLVRLEGVLMAWEAAVRRFIGHIRRQLLMWKTLPKEEKFAKIAQFKREFSDS